ncbi:hypothetical protein ILYODFUR_033678 [Ilyodon furcidens]|uniref:Uncharacterized protein n=1 Tax=Ilyodon furcidens TaxID=33524 RepID=A0ABV0TZY5_9TELE
MNIALQEGFLDVFLFENTLDIVIQRFYCGAETPFTQTCTVPNSFKHFKRSVLRLKIELHLQQQAVNLFVCQVNLSNSITHIYTHLNTILCISDCSSPTSLFILLFFPTFSLVLSISLVYVLFVFPH